MRDAVSVGLRLPKKTLRELDALSEETKLDRSAIVRKLLSSGLKEFKKEKALDLYRKGRVTFSKAAEIAETNVWEFEQFLVQNNVVSDYSLDDLKKELSR